MTKVAPRNFAALLKDLPGPYRLVLVFGPDEAQVRDRLRALADQSGVDLADPFSAVSLSGQDVADDPARLADEAGAIGLLGAPKLVRVNDLTDKGLAGVTALLDAPQSGNLVIASAGDLARTSKLRKLCESHDAVAAVACYPEDARDLAPVAQEMAAALGLTVEPDAQAMLIAATQGNRGVLRQELEKLAAYCNGAPVTPADVAAVGAELGLAAYDPFIDAVLGGDGREAQAQIERLLAEGEAEIALLRALARRLWQIASVAAAVADGQARDAAIGALRPPLFWKAKAGFARQLQLWPAAATRRALAAVLEAERQIKSVDSAGGILAVHLIQALTRRAAQMRQRLT